MSHATVSVNDEGADEVWAVFRVGGLGATETATWEQRAGGVFVLRGAVRSFRGWRHQRALWYQPGHFLLVDDKIEHTPADATIRSHIPLAPQIVVTQPAPQWHRLSGSNELLEIIALRGQWSTSVRQGTVSEGFGRARPRAIVDMEAAEDGFCTYLIKQPECELFLDVANKRLTGGHCNDVIVRLLR